MSTKPVSESLEPQEPPYKVEAKIVPPALLWTVNMVLVAATPIIFVYGTVLPLLAETAVLWRTNAPPSSA